MQILRFLCPFWSAFCFVEIFSQGMRACGDTVMPMFITLTGVGALRIAWILFYPSQTIFDTLLCYPLSWIITSLIYLAYYYQGHWIRMGHLAQKES
ncbi:MAG: MATE family efflux transporter, partial [Solobacterium sp.]|nr:MATE family efflux transporter [Solobacterium sp.]